MLASDANNVCNSTKAVVVYSELLSMHLIMVSSLSAFWRFRTKCWNGILMQLKSDEAMTNTEHRLSTEDQAFDAINSAAKLS